MIVITEFVSKKLEIEPRILQSAMDNIQKANISRSIDKVRLFEEAVSSFDTLFCRQCYRYDCAVHFRDSNERSDSVGKRARRRQEKK